MSSNMSVISWKNQLCKSKLIDEYSSTFIFSGFYRITSQIYTPKIKNEILFLPETPAAHARPIYRTVYFGFGVEVALAVLFSISIKIPYTFVLWVYIIIRLVTHYFP